MWSRGRQYYRQNPVYTSISLTNTPHIPFAAAAWLTVTKKKRPEVGFAKPRSKAIRSSPASLLNKCQWVWLTCIKCNCKCGEFSFLANYLVPPRTLSKLRGWHPNSSPFNEWSLCASVPVKNNPWNSFQSFCYMPPLYPRNWSNWSGETLHLETEWEHIFSNIA